MRSLSSKHAQSALVTGLAGFTFFTLAWHFAIGWGLGFSLGLAALMGAISALGIWALSRNT
jgi:hypothetical protein